MKSLQYTLKESLRIGINDQPEGVYPEDWNELREIIEKRLEKTYDLDLNDIDISNISSLDGLFKNTNVRTVNISDWDVSNVDNCEYMFGNCTSLKFVDMKNWKPNKLIGVKDMFLYCRSFGTGSNVDVSNWKENDLNMKILTNLYAEAINPENEIIFPNWFKNVYKI